MKINSILFLFLFFTELLYAQDIPNTEVKVVEGFKPSIPESIRLNENAIFVDTLKKERKQEYKFINLKLKSNYKTTILKPAIVKPDKISRIYNTSLSLGIGYKLKSDINFLYNSNRSKTTSYSLFFRNFNKGGSINNNKVASSNQIFSIYFKHIMEKNIINANLDYNRNSAYSYGHVIDIKDNELKTRFNYTKLSFHLLSKNNLNTQLKHNSIFFISDLNENSERRLHISTSLSKDFKNYPLALDLSVDNYSNYNSSQQISFLQNTSTQLISVAPSVNRNYFNADFTFFLVFDYESQEGVGVFPELIAEKQLVKDVLLISLGLEKNKLRNTYKILSNHNPFIHTLGSNQFIIPDDTTLDLRTTESKEVFFKITNMLAKEEVWNNSIRYGSFSNFSYFDNYQSDYNRFLVYYLDVLQLHLNSSYYKKINSMIELSVNADYYNWNNKNIAHKPHLFLDVNTVVNLRNKIKFSPVVRYISNQNSFSVYEKNLPSRLYLDLVIKYNYSNRLSMLINLNNLTNSKNDIWRGYQDIGFNGIFSVNWSFQ